MIEPTKAARRPSRRRSDGSRRSDGDGDGDARASARRVDGRESVRSALDSTRFDSSRGRRERTRRTRSKPNLKPRRDGTGSAGREASSDAFLSSAPGGAKTSDLRRRRFFSRGNARRESQPRATGFRFEPTSTSTSTARERHVRVRDAAVRQSHAYAPRSTRSVQRRI